MKTITAALTLAASVHAATPVLAGKACVQNSGGYALQWWYKDIQTGVEGTHSDNYTAGHMRCMDVNAYGVQEGDLLNIMVHAEAGVTKASDTAIIYNPQAAAATFTCTGSTVNFVCKLNGSYSFHYDGSVTDEDLLHEAPAENFL